MRRRLLVAALISALSSTAERSQAQEALGIEPTTPTPPATEGIEQAVVARYWQLGRTRPFLAWTIEAGYVYVRPRFTAGYGRPYWSFVGVDAYPLLSANGVGQYFGIGGTLPGLTLRVGGRYFRPLARTLLMPRESHSRQDVSLVEGPRSGYLAWEAELGATQPVWAGSAFAVLTGYRTELLPPGFHLYEESLRVVIEPPYVWRARVGYLLSLGTKGAIRVGPAAEVIGVPGREAHVVRGGVVASVSINAYLEAQASFIPVLVSPDRIGILGGDFGQLGVRFRWATNSTPDPARVREHRLRQAGAGSR